MPVGTKAAEYAELVAACRKCQLCQGVENVGDPLHPSPWARMLGSLNAELVIVGQDFSARDREDPNREPDPRIPTNKNLLRLIAAAGIDPNHAYLTNAMLCLKPGKHLGAPVRAEWFKACQPLLRRTVGVVAPRAVAALGSRAWASLLDAFRLRPVRLAQAVGQSPIQAPAGPALFAMRHCGGRGLIGRPLDRQAEDWRQLGEWLRRAA